MPLLQALVAAAVGRLLVAVEAQHPVVEEVVVEEPLQHPAVEEEVVKEPLEHLR